MTPEFSKAVDPLFLHVLGLLERIARDENPLVEEERLRIRGWLDQAQGILGESQDWLLAKYALVSWIDDVLIDAPWEGRHWWNENKLEWELFGSNDREWMFFVKAKNEASPLARKDALEVFYVCVVLGFRGIYRDQARAEFLSEQYELPPDLAAWAKQTSMAIRLGQGRPPISDASVPIQGARPLEGPATLIWSVFLGVVLTVVLVLVAGYTL
jgi:type VI secretion system protein ImpK